MKFIAIILLWALGSSVSAEPKAFIDGYELLRLCESAAESGFSRATDCLGYVSGLSDTYETFVDLETFTRQWCWPPGGMINRQMAQVVYAYLRYNAALLDSSAALLASIAFFEAYPRN